MLPSAMVASNGLPWPHVARLAGDVGPMCGAVAALLVAIILAAACGARRLLRHVHRIARVLEDVAHMRVEAGPPHAAAHPFFFLPLRIVWCVEVNGRCRICPAFSLQHLGEFFFVGFNTPFLALPSQVCTSIAGSLQPPRFERAEFGAPSLFF